MMFPEKRCKGRQFSILTQYSNQGFLLRLFGRFVLCVIKPITKNEYYERPEDAQHLIDMV